MKIDVFAKKLKKSEKKTIEILQEMIHFGYTNRVIIDYKNNAFIYLDSSNVDQNSNANFIFETCPQCGGEYPMALFGFSFATILFMFPTTGAIAVWINNAALSSISAFVILFLIVGYPSIFSCWIWYTVVDAKRIRPLVSKYLSIVTHTRSVEGIKISDIAKSLNEDEKKTYKNIKFLIRRKLLLGVTIKKDKVFYLDDDINFDRFKAVECQNCGGNSVAIYGRANSCPYCGAPLNVEKSYRTVAGLKYSLL